MGTRLVPAHDAPSAPGDLAAAAAQIPTVSSLTPPSRDRKSRMLSGPDDGLPRFVPPASLETGAVAYWCGSFADSPMQNVILAGVSFPRYTERISQAEGSLVTKRSPQLGAIQYLTPAQVERIHQAVKSRVVRWAGQQEVYREIVMTAEHGLVTYERTKPRAGWVVMRDGRYKPRAQDEPLGRYVYCLSVEDAAKRMGAQWQSGDVDAPSFEP